MLSQGTQKVSRGTQRLPRRSRGTSMALLLGSRSKHLLSRCTGSSGTPRFGCARVPARAELKGASGAAQGNQGIPPSPRARPLAARGGASALAKPPAEPRRYRQGWATARRLAVHAAVSIHLHRGAWTAIIIMPRAHTKRTNTSAKRRNSAPAGTLAGAGLRRGRYCRPPTS